jgi:hypothetical protein
MSLLHRTIPTLNKKDISLKKKIPSGTNFGLKNVQFQKTIPDGMACLDEKKAPVAATTDLG